MKASLNFFVHKYYHMLLLQILLFHIDVMVFVLLQGLVSLFAERCTPGPGWQFPSRVLGLGLRVYRV